MPTLTADPRHLRLRFDLIVRQVSDDGRYVIKDLKSGRFFNLGAEEVFLLSQLNGKSSADEIQAAYEAKFDEPLDEEDLADFLELVQERGLVQEVAESTADSEHGESPGNGRVSPESRPHAESAPRPVPATEPKKSSSRWNLQRLLVWRFRLFDPYRLFEWAEPKVRFIWTRHFLLFSAGVILAALLLAWVERGTFINQFSAGWSWQTIILAWLALAVTTAFHECAHGLTCKHYGGEVREMGFLMMYFIPCFYCNVSDSWLFPEKWKRVWVTLAGPYCDLFLWSIGLLTWRVAQPGTMVHDFAWFVASICGVRVFFNVNPLLKLDGYYLLSDLLDIPNLRRRARGRFKSYLRWILWGAERPEPEPQGGILLAYGSTAWCFSLVFLTFTVAGFASYFFSKATALGIIWTLLMGTVSVQRLFRDFTKGEAAAMLRERRGRVTTWVLVAVGAAFTLATVPIEDRAGGTFLIRPAARMELRAPVAGFLRAVAADEGGVVSSGQQVVRLEVPVLESQLAQKCAERRESAAKLRLLEIGPRPEEVEEQRLRVKRMQLWRDLARHDLERTRAALLAEIAEIEAQILQFRAESERAAETVRRDHALLQRQALQIDQFRETEKVWKVATARLTQAEARLRARKAEGTLTAEAELARRETEAAEAESALRLLEAGSRPDEIEAEKARHTRIEEEIRFLEEQQSKLSLKSPVSGVIVTPRLKEQIGRYFHEGDLIAVVETPERVEAEVAIAEHEVSRIQAGQQVVLKVRALPFHTFKTRVDRIAEASLRTQEQGKSPSAVPHPEVQAPATNLSAAFLVYCVLDDPRHTLKTGMTGHARVLLGPTPVGSFLFQRAHRMIRTEFWW